MSDQFSQQEDSKMVHDLNAPRIDRISGEEDDTKSIGDLDDSDSFFVGNTSPKRVIENEETLSSSKRFKLSPENEVTSGGEPVKLAYSGKPVEMFDGSTPYDYAVHEPVPKNEAYTEHNLYVERMYPSVIGATILPVLEPYIDEDDEIMNFVKFFRNHTVLLLPEATRIGIMGETGSGKSTTLNALLQMPGLSNASGASASVTLVPQSFISSTHRENYRAEISVFHRRKITNMLKDWSCRINEYVALHAEERDEEEHELIRTQAGVAQENFEDLFPDRIHFTNMDDIEAHFRDEKLQEPEVLGKYCLRLTDDVMERLSLEDVDLDTRTKIVSAHDLSNLHEQTNTFSERGGLASVVIRIQTEIHSPLLAQGIEIADLPGLNDRNDSITKNALDYFERCSSVVVVANMVRALSNKDIAENLERAMRKKKIENICLVLRGKEQVEDRIQQCTPEEKVKIATTEAEIKRLRKEMSQESRDKLEQITQELRHLKMEARNNNVVSQFKKKFVERGNSAELKVIIISNVDHQAYVDGPGANHRPILPVAETGILELRAHLCEKPALDRVLGNIRQIKEVLRYCQRILLCISTPQLLRRETVTTLFANRAQMPFAKYHDMMTEGVKSFRKSVLMKLKADWNQPLLSLMDDFSKTYTSCLAAFFRKGGVHWPTVKRIKANSSVDLNRLILNKTIDDLAILENKTYTVADRCIDDIINDLTGKVQDVKSELERLPQIGGANLDLVFQFFDRETKACTEQITESVEELKERMRSVFANALIDENGNEAGQGAYHKAMAKVYKDAMKTNPKGSGVNKKRINHLKSTVTAAKGPFGEMADEIFKALKELTSAWANDTDKVINDLFADMQRTLSASYDGKKLSVQRRAEIAPKVSDAIFKAMHVLETYLSDYDVPSGSSRRSLHTL